MKKSLLIIVALLSSVTFNALAITEDGQLESGFRGIIDITSQIGIGSHSRDMYQEQAGFTGGFQINHLVFVGGGVSPTLHLYEDAHNSFNAKFVLPIYGAVRFDFLDRKITPFVEGRAGYYIDTDNSDASGLYIYGGAGVRISRFSISAGYTNYGNGGRYYKEASSFIGLKAAIEF